MEEHAGDLIKLLLFVVGGGLTIAWWAVRTIIARIDELEKKQGIREQQWMERHHALDVRVTRIESHCSLYHKDRMTEVWRLTPTSDNGE